MAAALSPVIGEQINQPTDRLGRALQHQQVALAPCGARRTDILRIVSASSATGSTAPSTNGPSALFIGSDVRFAFFVSPNFGIGCDLRALLFLFRTGNYRFAVKQALVSTLALCCLVGPRTLRNELVLGNAIALHSNLGLELAVANYPRELETRDPRQAFRALLKAI